MKTKKKLLKKCSFEWKTRLPGPNIFGIYTIYITRKYPLRGHILAPPEGLRAPEVPGVNPGGRPQESGGDSKAI